jgi:hypothetical protein
MHAAARKDVQISDGTTSLDDNYPRYRDAKRTSVDFGFHSLASVNLAPETRRREFTLFQLYWQAHHSLRVSSVRAPPLQT